MGGDLTYLYAVKSKFSVDMPPDISCVAILSQMLTFLFAGSDTSSLTMTWTFYLLSQHEELQTWFRREMCGLRAKFSALDTSTTGTANYTDMFAALEALQLLDCILGEPLRLIPALYSSLRVVT
jgi:cytochrome P450